MFFKEDMDRNLITEERLEHFMLPEQGFKCVSGLFTVCRNEC